MKNGTGVVVMSRYTYLDFKTLSYSLCVINKTKMIHLAGIRLWNVTFSECLAISHLPLTNPTVFLHETMSPPLNAKFCDRTARHRWPVNEDDRLQWNASSHHSYDLASG